MGKSRPRLQSQMFSGGKPRGRPHAQPKGCTQPRGTQRSKERDYHEQCLPQVVRQGRRSDRCRRCRQRRPDRCRRRRRGRRGQGHLCPRLQLLAARGARDLRRHGGGRGRGRRHRRGRGRLRLLRHPRRRRGGRDRPGLREVRDQEHHRPGLRRRWRQGAGDLGSRRRLHGQVRAGREAHERVPLSQQPAHLHALGKRDEGRLRLVHRPVEPLHRPRELRRDPRGEPLELHLPLLLPHA